MSKIRVLIVDDHTIVRQGLRVLIEQAQDMEVVGEAEDGAKAVANTSKLRPDVVVMDLSMPFMNGLEATRQIRSQAPCTKVLVLSTFSGDDLVAQSIESGAKGFLLKQSAANDLLNGIRKAKQGISFFSSSVAKRLADFNSKFPPTQRPRHSGHPLTAREQQVLELVSRGYANKQVACLLKISIKTVEKHRQQVMNKLNLHDVASLTRYAYSKEAQSKQAPRVEQ